MEDIEKYLEDLPESEEEIKKGIMQQLMEASNKIHFNSRYGAGSRLVVGIDAAAALTEILSQEISSDINI